MRKRILSGIMTIILLIVNFVLPFSTNYNVKAEDISTYKLSIDKKLMTGTLENPSFPFSYVDFECMNSLWEIIVSEGYTNVISYKAPSDGQIRIDSLNVKINGTVSGREIEVAVTDADNNILSNDGNIITLNADKTAVAGATVQVHEIQAGEELNFVFHGNSGTTNSIECTAAILFSVDGENWNRVDREGRLWAQSSENVTQGVDGFYYYYSTQYEKTSNEPEEKKQYQLDIVPQNMEGKLENPSFPFSYVDYECMTSLWEIIVSKDYTNIVSYQAPSDGKIRIDSLNVKINGNVDGRQIEFAVADDTGLILTNEGDICKLNATTSTISGMSMDEIDIQAGQGLNFVFHGIKGTTNSIECTAAILFSEDGESWKRVDREGRLWAQTQDNTQQGTDGFYYRYSKDYIKNEYVPKAETLPGEPTVPEPDEKGYLPTYKIDYEADLMEASNLNPTFPWSMPSKEYHCMTNPTGEKIVSAGYANIVTYTAQKKGTIVFKDATITLNNPKGHTVLFAITDKEGNILYPANGTLALLDEENNTIRGNLINGLQVKKGDELNFIFEGVSGETSSIGLMGVLINLDVNKKETRLTNKNGQFYPLSGSLEQDEAGFTYRYAKKFENRILKYVEPPKTEELPGNPTIPKMNSKGLVPTYKIKFDVDLMKESVINPSFPWSMPGKEYHCMTNPTGEKIVSAGYANIVTYKAKKSGNLIFKNAMVKLNNPDKCTVLFAVTDNRGNIIWPENKTLVVLNKDKSSALGTFLNNYKIKSGEEINFIFEGVSGNTASISFMGILVHVDTNGNETRLTHENGQFYPANGSLKQGASGFCYRYAKSFTNIITGYTTPKATTVQLGEGIQVVVSKNKEDLADYVTSAKNQAVDFDELEIIKEQVELRYVAIPWILAGIFMIVFGVRWICFFKNSNKDKQGGQNEKN